MTDQEFVAENFHHLADHLTDEKELQAYQNLAPFFEGMEEQIANLRAVGDHLDKQLFHRLANNIQRAINEGISDLAQEIKNHLD